MNSNLTLERFGDDLPKPHLQINIKNHFRVFQLILCQSRWNGHAVESFESLGHRISGLFHCIQFRDCTYLEHYIKNSIYFSISCLIYFRLEICVHKISVGPVGHIRTWSLSLKYKLYTPLKTIWPLRTHPLISKENYPIHILRINNH